MRRLAIAPFDADTPILCVTLASKRDRTPNHSTTIMLADN